MHGQFEVTQRITEDALETCPTVADEKVCGEPIQRLIASAGFRLRGGNWAFDGYSAGSKGSFL